MRRSICLAAFALIALANVERIAEADVVIADSVAEFSGVQGQDSWYYGYYDGPFNPSAFKLMTEFDVVGAPENWTVHYNPPSPFYWTLLSKEGGHPNGTQASQGQALVEQWAVRRWVSEVAGEITITGNIADLDVGGGNGVIGRIFLGAVEVFSATVNNGSIAGVDYSITLAVAVGDTIDFAIDPRNADPHFDLTRFTSTIAAQAVPEPSALVSAALGLAGSLGRLARRRHSPGRSAD